MGHLDYRNASGELASTVSTLHQMIEVHSGKSSPGLCRGEYIERSWKPDSDHNVQASGRGRG